MKFFSASQDRDDELLSAYLDDELSPAERAKLERRLQADSTLRLTLEGLRRIKTRLAGLPPVKPPRNFTLTPKMAGQPVRRPSPLFPILNWATGIAAVLFAMLVAADLGAGYLASGRLAEPNLAQAPLAMEAPTSEPEAADEEGLAQIQKAETLPALEALASLSPTPEISATPSSPIGAAVGGGGEGGTTPTPPQEFITPSGTPTGVESLNVTSALSLTATPEVAGRDGMTDESADLRTLTATPVINEIPAPSPSPSQPQAPAGYFAQPAASPFGLTPLRLAEVGLAALLALLVIVSIFIHRK